jgi:ABC-type antimicrobial peptide transport system permease subunit
MLQWCNGLSSSQREMALRLALGATYSQIRSSLITRIMAITGTALGIGLIAALAGKNTMKAFLYGVQPQLSNVVVWSALLLGIVALISSYIPALLSRFINPAELLRCE